jgi:hypothetical protein
MFSLGQQSKECSDFPPKKVVVITGLGKKGKSEFLLGDHLGSPKFTKM